MPPAASRQGEHGTPCLAAFAAAAAAAAAERSACRTPPAANGKKKGRRRRRREEAQSLLLAAAVLRPAVVGLLRLRPQPLVLVTVVVGDRVWQLL
jgi:hypothetical protein